MSRIDEAIGMAAKKNSDQLPLYNKSKENVWAETSSSLLLAAYQQIEPHHVDNPLLIPLVDPNGFAAEQFRKLRSIIIQRTGQKGFENTLLVTSAVSGEGKSLTAVNLALSLAMLAEYSVVFVDIDLRNPQLHQLLDIKTEYGLVHHLRDEIPVEKIITKVGLGNLSIIPAGESVADPLNLLTSQRMKSLVRELKGRYPDRYVLFDAPPTLPFADMQVLGELVDNIVYVCREGHSTMGQISQGLDALSDTNILGIVCNDMNLSLRMEYSHYYGLR